MASEKLLLKKITQSKGRESFHSSLQWGISEVESATGKSSACDGFGQKLVRLSTLFGLVGIRKSINNFFIKYLLEYIKRPPRWTVILQ